MKYGYFDDSKREYVITSPNTPKPWSNYLGSTKYGAIITNNAGGYSFYKSSGMGRFMRMRFNSVPLDQPGRNLYFFDKSDNDFWSGAWQPVGKPLSEYKSECRHGLGYTKIISTYKNIEVSTTFYVPNEAAHEVWQVKVRNLSDEKRNLRGFSYIEYATSWNALDDLLNLQYVQYTGLMKYVDGMIDHGTNVFIPEMPENFKEKDQGRHTFQALCGAMPCGYDLDREAFMGNYRIYQNPEVVESGTPKNSTGYGDNPCGSLAWDIDLAPNEEKQFAFIVGIGKAEKEGAEIREKYRNNPALFEEELEAVKSYWHQRIQNFQATTPDHEFNSTANVWGSYNSLVTFNWSRAASLIYSGIDRDGLGYRDSVQDLMGVLQSIPKEAQERLELMLSGQESTGGAKPVIVPVSHSPGKEAKTDESAYRSDDALWLFNAVPAFIKETGDVDFLHKVIPYADKGEDTVLMHLRNAIQFNLDRSGNHGFPCGLHADWNDCLKFGFDGESIFVAMQQRYGLKMYIELAELVNELAEVEWAKKLLEDLDKRLQESAWDGEWFMRGYRKDGFKFGSKESDEGKIFLNPQTWSIISGAATEEQESLVMKNVAQHLETDYGVKLCEPPYTQSDYNIVRAQLMNPGLKENGGIFMHTQPWAVMAYAMLGKGNEAYKVLRSFMPAAYNEKAEIREIEPYVVCQSTHAEHSPKHGTSRVPWLSGSATWLYYAITQYVLGIQPEYNGLTINPCIPSEWKDFEVNRNFRGSQLTIKVSNPNGVQRGVKELKLDGKVMGGDFISVAELTGKHQIEVQLG